jgi:hypothetical protein
MLSFLLTLIGFSLALKTARRTGAEKAKERNTRHVQVNVHLIEVISANFM